MKIGLVGFSGSGKTTVFNALAGQRVETGYGATPGKTNLGVIKVPDARVEALSAIFQPKKKTLAEITFMDVAAAGGNAEAQALDNATLSAMREVDALCQVVRGFSDPEGSAENPLAEVEAFEAEILLADQIVVEKRLERLKKEKGKANEQAVVEKLLSHLSAGHPIRELALAEAELALMSGYRFLSQKPLLLVLNVEEGQATASAPTNLSEHARAHHLALIVLAGSVEMDIAQMPAEEQTEFAASFGLSEPALGRFIREAYSMLSLISFLTAGEDECRAWTIRSGTIALKAAGKIHSDIERGFIRAEVTRWEDLVSLGSEAKCRQAGKTRLEGKEYVVQDGDVAHFRFNV